MLAYPHPGPTQQAQVTANEGIRTTTGTMHDQKRFSKMPQHNLWFTTAARPINALCAGSGHTNHFFLPWLRGFHIVGE